MAGRVPKGLLTGMGTLGCCVNILKPAPEIEGAPNAFTAG